MAGAYPRPRKKTAEHNEGYGTTQLENEMNRAGAEGGGIQPNAHPQYETNVTPGERFGKGIAGMSKSMANMFDEAIKKLRGGK